jgi:hypothetical protein
MAFEFKKFLVENKLTTASKLKVLKEEEEDNLDTEPTSKDITSASKSTSELAKKQNQLAKLLKHKDELVSKFKSNEINIDQYKQMIGNIPQHIKTLTADIERLEGTGKEEDLYEVDGIESKIQNQISNEERLNQFDKLTYQMDKEELHEMLMQLAWQETTMESIIASVIENQ